MHRYRTLSTLFGLALVGFAPRVAAQRVAVGDPLEDYARIVSTLDSLPNPSFAVRPLADSVWASVLRRGGHPWAARLKEDSSSWSLTPLSFRATGNSAL